ncbi:hypothetical protein SUNI508_01101 [Seiridium unicorne]|uniref:Uncharacterized protein n=1 Tax=Seiridium unicorne TaxID=138068 RepID=A0ABR2UX35_9PEZI
MWHWKVAENKTKMPRLSLQFPIITAPSNPMNYLASYILRDEKTSEFGKSKHDESFVDGYIPHEMRVALLQEHESRVHKALAPRNNPHLFVSMESEVMLY